MERKLAVSMFGQKRLSREGGIEIVAKELCTRMVQKENVQVLCEWRGNVCGYILWRFVEFGSKPKTGIYRGKRAKYNFCKK